MKGSAIVLAVIIGAVATWLWQNREAQSTANPTSQPAVVVPAEQSLPPMAENPPPQPAPEQPLTEPSAQPSQPAIVTPPPVRAAARFGDDSTYEKMLAYAQLRASPGSEDTARDITQWRQSFLATPDDPEWARKMEQSLWNFFQKKTASGDGPQVTSVSCRESGCEVQALSQPFCGGKPCELQSQEEKPPESENVDPLELFRGGAPGNLPVSRMLIMQQPVGDRAGIIITYRRTGLKAEIGMP